MRAMYPDNSSISYRIKQQGLGLPSAIFLILVMALIVAAIHQLNELNAKAFYAAESGAQAATGRILSDGGACGNYNQTLTAPGMSNCSFQSTCDEHMINAETFNTITSTGLCGSGVDQATRIIQVRIRQ